MNIPTRVKFRKTSPHEAQKGIQQRMSPGYETSRAINSMKRTKKFWPI